MMEDLLVAGTLISAIAAMVTIPIILIRHCRNEVYRRFEIEERRFSELREDLEKIGASLKEVREAVANIAGKIEVAFHQKKV